MAGEEWQLYTPAPGGPAADDTLLELDVSDDTDNAAGTVHQDTIAAVVQAGLGLTTEGDLVVGGASGVPQRLAAGTSGYVLTAHGSGTLPTWAAGGGGSGNVTQLVPSGDTTGATDTAAINAVISAGGSAVLAFTGTGTPFYVSAPLTPSTGANLKGAMPWSASTYDAYGPGTGNIGGTVIQAVAAFSGAAVIDMSNSTATQYYGASLSDFTLDCSQATSSTLIGILVDGAWGASFIEGVMVFNCGGNCLSFQVDNTTNYVPDDWHVFRCKFSASYGGYGVYADNVPDSWFTDCESSENQLDNWYINWSTNTSFTRCKGENSTAGAGFRFGGLGGPGDVLSLTGCTTHLNYEDGFLWDATSYEPASGSYILANCFALSDNQAAGTTYAAYRSDGCPAIIQATGCYGYGAYYGASQVTGAGGMVFTGSSLSGTGTALHDDGSNTFPILNSVPVPAQRTTLGTAFNSGTGTAAQTVTGMSMTLPVGTWKVTASIPMTYHTTDAGTQALSWTFSGTASSATVTWQIAGASGITGGAGTVITTASPASPAMTSTGLVGTFTGRVAVTASGTLQLKVTSGTSGDECTIPVGAWIQAEPST